MISKIDTIMSNLPRSTDEVIRSETVGWEKEPFIQRIPEVVENTQSEFLKLCGEILKSDIYIKGKIHRQGIIGRYLDDSGNVELYRTWNRFMCIDESYREWKQPYFTMVIRTKRSRFSVVKYSELNSICINAEYPELVSYFRDKKISTIIQD